MSCLLFLTSLRGSQLPFTCVQVDSGLAGAGWARMVLAGMLSSAPVVSTLQKGCLGLLVMTVVVPEKSNNKI